MKTELILITMENGDEIKAELYPEAAPKTVENFLKLVDEKFYDGLIFHRVIKGFMIQGGDPTGTGMGGSKDTIVGEFRANGFQNDLAHTRGVLSMARTNMPNSASSQFFIMHQDAPHLDGQYAAFGKERLLQRALQLAVRRVTQPSSGGGKFLLAPPALS